MLCWQRVAAVALFVMLALVVTWWAERDERRTRKKRERTKATKAG